MTLVQMQHHSASAPTASTQAVPATHRTLTVGDAAAAAGPQVDDDMTVEVALSVLAGARSAHLLICDEDGQVTRVVTQAELAAVRDGDAYTDRVRLRDVLGEGGPLAGAQGGASGPAGSAASAGYLPVLALAG
ncbi:hypothetical protein [Streptomyces sp. NPDC091268]|uniref:hypothetical protein n=1 Tax=Streptomyces sp. NPDC091268 TaxID=3365979 RepID=UPI0038217A44